MGLIKKKSSSLKKRVVNSNKMHSELYKENIDLNSKYHISNGDLIYSGARALYHYDVMNKQKRENRILSKKEKNEIYYRNYEFLKTYQKMGFHTVSFDWMKNKIRF